MTVVIVMLRWLTGAIVIAGITVPFFNNKHFRNIIRFIAPVVIVSNLLF